MTIEITEQDIIESETAIEYFTKLAERQQEN